MTPIPSHPTIPPKVLTAPREKESVAAQVAWPAASHLPSTNLRRSASTTPEHCHRSKYHLMRRRWRPPVHR